MSEVEQEEKLTQDPIAGIGTMVFGKWDATDVVCEDLDWLIYQFTNNRYSTFRW